MNAKGFKKLITLQDILLFFSRYPKYWKLTILSSLLGLSLALAYFVYGKPSYYSKCVVEWSYLDLPLKSEISDSKGNTRWDSVTFQVIYGLQSKWLAERTALRLGLIENVGEFDSIWEKYISKIKVTSSAANHLEIEVYVYEPWLAKIWPQAMLLEYHDYLTESRVKHRDMLIKGFSKEMERIEENLKAEAERDRQFESENKILEMYISNNKLEQLPTQMLTYRAQLDSMEDMLGFIESTAPTSGEKLALLQKYREKPLPVGTIVTTEKNPDPFVVKSSSPSIVTGTVGTSMDPLSTSAVPRRTGNSVVVMPEQSSKTEAWEAIDTNLKEVSREYQRLSANLLPGHEKMRDLRKQMEALGFALDAEWEKAFTSFKLEKTHLQQRLEDLQLRMPEYRKLIAGYDDYKRDFRLNSSGRIAWESAYVGMKTRLTAMEYTGPEVQVEFLFHGFTDIRDDIPVAPNKQKLLTYALALSLGLGLGLPVFTERLRFTSSFIAEAEKYCQFPACGIVPLLTVEERSVVKQLTNGEAGGTQSNTHANESFRLIRSSLPFYAPVDNKMKVVMVTSARPNDGKSTVAAHLAKSFADSGENVLLIDGDLRRGSLYRFFDLPRQHSGLLDILSLGVDWESVLQSPDVKNLHYLSHGSDGRSGHDLLFTKHFKDLIEKLRSRFDRIIVDTPPLLGISDAILISRVVDGVVFVIRADQTTQRDVATASEILHQSGAAVYGFVLNCVNLNKIDNYYYYGRYYSRYYEPKYYNDVWTVGVG